MRRVGINIYVPEVISRMKSSTIYALRNTTPFKEVLRVEISVLLFIFLNNVLLI